MNPRVDIYENDDELLLAMDLPGVERDALDLRYDRGVLTIHGKREKDGEPFEYERSFSVPDTIDAASIGAELTAGVLTVHLPKAAHTKPRQIAIQSS